MDLFAVDKEKCQRDHICVEVCPAKIIVSQEKNGIPKPVRNAEEFCIFCGHCVAVCPHGALSHMIMAPNECAPLQKGLLLTPEQVEHTLRSRRSIRSYRKKDVEREKITKLIDMARYAPSGHNSQPVRWRIIYDRQEVQKLAAHVVDWMRFLLKEQKEFALSFRMDRLVKGWDAGTDPICRNAPHLIVTHAPKENGAAPAACTIALSYLDLAAPSFGLGTCWAGYFNNAANVWPPLQEALDLPDGDRCFGSMMLGYPRYGYHRLPKRNEAHITWR